MWCVDRASLAYSALGMVPGAVLGVVLAGFVLASFVLWRLVR